VSFDHPFFLWALLFLGPGFLFSVLHYRRRAAALSALGGSSGKGPLTRSLRRRYILSALFFNGSCACAVLALAAPYWGYRQVPEFSRGVDVVLALDLSRSMNARDQVPSRLVRALSLASAAVIAEPNARFGVVLGKGSAVLAIPLTEDSESVLNLLGGISSSSLSSAGTDLERLVDASLAAFQSSFPTRRLVLLFSDGEALEGALSAAAERARDAGIQVSAVALGSLSGAPVPALAESAEPLLREDGTPVTSFLREEPLRRLASASGGILISGSEADAEGKLISHIEALSVPGAQEGYRKERKGRSGLFALAALLAFGLSKLAERTIRRPK